MAQIDVDLYHFRAFITNGLMTQQLKSILFKITIIGLFFLFFSKLCLWSGSSLIVNDDHLPKSDVIIVLGFPSNNDGTPSPTMKARVEKAVELFEKGYASTIILSGGAVKNEFAEAEVMAALAKDLGIPESAIIVETESKDTLQNARFTAEIMNKHNWHTAIIVTSPYHTYRALRLFLDLGVEASVVAAKYPPELSWYHRLKEIIHEYVLLLWYRIAGDRIAGDRIAGERQHNELGPDSHHLRR